jgi:hypothetical protein
MSEQKKTTSGSEQDVGPEKELRGYVTKMKLRLNPTGEKAFSARIEREVRRLLDSKKIQGMYESAGDFIINDYVDKKYPYGQGNMRNDRLNTLLKSNWYLNIIYKKENLPLPPQKFINEKVYRYHKRGASLFEWFVGLYFLGTGGNLPARKMQITKNLHNYFDKVFNQITSGENDDRELKQTWYEFEQHRDSLKGTSEDPD